MATKEYELYRDYSDWFPFAYIRGHLRTAKITSEPEWRRIGVIKRHGKFFEKFMDYRRVEEEQIIVVDNSGESHILKKTLRGENAASENSHSEFIFQKHLEAAIVEESKRQENIPPLYPYYEFIFSTGNLEQALKRGAEEYRRTDTHLRSILRRGEIIVIPGKVCDHSEIVSDRCMIRARSISKS